MNSNSQITGPINIGNPIETTVYELAEKIVGITKSSSEIVFEKLPEDDPKKRKPDITLAKQYLEWKPEVNLNDGLSETIQYFSRCF